MTKKRVACIGTGNIAETHAAVLSALQGVELAAAVDPNPDSLSHFLKKWNIPLGFGSVEELLSENVVDVAHVLVPPPLHCTIAEKLLNAGVHVFLEKPMAQNSAECDILRNAAAKSGAALGVNHNFIHHPSHRKVKSLIERNRIGNVRHVECRYNVPLRQLGAGQLGHWMFNSPLNLLLEQVVHPLSQICDLMGAARDVTVLPAPPHDLPGDRSIFRKWMISLICEKGTAQLYVALGETYPSWAITIIGDDGLIAVDYVRSRVSFETSGRYPDFFDDFRNGLGISARLTVQSFGNAAAYVGSLLKLRPRSDAFFRSMSSSIARFYRDLANFDADLAGGDGKRLVEICERIVLQANLRPTPRRQPAVQPLNDYEVLVIGGTGFIGSQVVAQFIAEGRKVGVLARGTNNLPSHFYSEAVRLIRGDARSVSDISRAVEGAKVVINLAHGGGGRSREETEKNLVGAAKVVAEACLAKGVKRLIFVSSISALYLGDPAQTVLDTTPPDECPDLRADYARAKVLAERELAKLCLESGLAVVILRPGVVVGQGTSPFHSGIGFYNRETHCLGWNAGRNALPLILVEDVASAIVKAADATAIDGKTYNLVGDVRLSAREYIEELAQATGRPLRYHPQSVLKLYAIETAKTVIKKLTGRTDPWPALRDLRSRGMPAAFDCAAAKRELGWVPTSDRQEFLGKSFLADDGS
ncbi:MAG: NAD-dependent epimerase/dehydratase family protein [Alphaproteobacteria bacterium]|mgnify:CR=1 FL=1|nr:NAD-dependent epimerase/dehydratase family protein [Alphaproteobacteria bacterium]